MADLENNFNSNDFSLISPEGNTDGTFGATISTDQRIGVFDLNTDITGKLNEPRIPIIDDILFALSKLPITFQVKMYVI